MPQPLMPPPTMSTSQWVMAAEVDGGMALTADGEMDL
jgi:hypothetical protein